MSGAYFDQFKIVALIALTNSSMMMILVVVVVLLLFKGVQLIPKRWQSLIELIYEHFHGVVKDNLGSEGLRYFPLIVSLFFFYSVFECVGLIPLCFYPNCSYCSHIGFVLFNNHRCDSSWVLEV